MRVEQAPVPRPRRARRSGWQRGGKRGPKNFLHSYSTYYLRTQRRSEDAGTGPDILLHSYSTYYLLGQRRQYIHGAGVAARRPTVQLAWVRHGYGLSLMAVVSSVRTVWGSKCVPGEGLAQAQRPSCACGRRVIGAGPRRGIPEEGGVGMLGCRPHSATPRDGPAAPGAPSGPAPGRPRRHNRAGNRAGNRGAG
jgi:hypothetical protein